ncbi:hypothetical protein N7537_009766 [Penicillium hordei]|uniref:Uncharacterized protein n=1 Tax=Penicillium hordei TaxID=40994 RepID=A0AAD6GWY0_9EURO|nr:uncharacterized protein N7537_009766 [Penicillium hordei]KAJ5592862.1 hypothetical protein N7537_009766 [Penicillium hordei]
MRGPKAGVRLLLEKSECLILEAPLVKKYDIIRRVRKALIEMSVSGRFAAIHAQNLASGPLKPRPMDF